jgi:hypothetical protein
MSLIRSNQESCRGCSIETHVQIAGMMILPVNRY